nr:hypothetical protein Q903MT_gene2059 [Picea sitchensis]
MQTSASSLPISFFPIQFCMRVPLRSLLRSTIYNQFCQRVSVAALELSYSYESKTYFLLVTTLKRNYRSMPLIYTCGPDQCLYIRVYLYSLSLSILRSLSTLIDRKRCGWEPVLDL